MTDVPVYPLPVPAYRSWTLTSVAVAALVTFYAGIRPPQEYGAIFFLPLAYAVVIGTSSAILRGAPSLLFAGLTIVAFLRYVVLPGLFTYNGGYIGRSLVAPSQSSIDTAIAVMAYELAAVMALATMLEGGVRRAAHKAVPDNQRGLPLLIPLALLAVAGFLCAVTPQATSLVSFIRPTILTDETAAPPQAVLFAMVFVVAKVFLCVSVMYRCANYRGPHRALMPWIALGAALLNVTIFFGAGRLAILLNAIVSLIFLVKYFGRRAVLPAVMVTLVFASVFNIVTIERQYFNSGAPLPVTLADEIQTYFGGVYNVAIGLEIPEVFPDATQLSVLAYDFVRPTIGLNILSRDWDITYSNIYFNRRMFMYIDRQSQIIPMVAQSSLFFGLYLSPMLSLLFVSIGYYILSLSARVRNAEMAFCLMLIVLRVSMLFGQNSMNMMSFLSIYLVIPVIIMFFAGALLKDAVRWR